MNAQHTALSPVASQSLQAIHWQTPTDQNPQYSGNELLIHYGSAMATPSNTVIVPVKTGATGGFKVEGLNGATGALKWTQTTDYVLPPHNWTPSYSPTLTPSNRLYFPGVAGSVYYISNPDSNGPFTPTQIFPYDSALYQANKSTYSNNVFINTPLVSDSAGDIYFGVQVTASGLAISSSVVRIDPSGSVTVAPVSSFSVAASKVVMNSAPALSNDGSTLYVALNSSNFSSGYLVALNSTTLAVLTNSLGGSETTALIDPHTGNNAQIPDDGTASPLVGPDGDVYFGVFENPYPSNNDRGWMLHFSSDLSQSKTPGAFGWDDTGSIVPASMVPGYSGSSTYLIATKYNNYVGIGTGDGQNKVAVLDPNATETDPVTGATVMKEVLTVLGPTPNHSGGVDEWCINSMAVDPATDSILVNSEDGKLYRWNLATNTLSQTITLTTGIGEAYTPTLIGPDGTVYAVNNATLFAVGNTPAPTSSAIFVKADTTTQGNWQTAYGADGYNVINDSVNDPSYAQVTPSGQKSYTWAATTSDVRALTRATNTSDRIAATWFAGSSFSVDVNITDNQPHQVALYVVDWDSTARAERVDVIDTGTGVVLNTQTATSFHNGEYFVWNLSGHVTIQFTLTGGSNAVMSGLFFGGPVQVTPPTATAAFVKTDTTTQGNWQSAYGADGYNVIGDSNSYPSYAQVTPSGQNNYTWAGSTSDVRALTKATNTSDRIAATWYNSSTFSVDVNITDGLTHQIALYVLDWDSTNRSERIDLVDTGTGTLLDTETATSFHGGEYFVWDISGNVTLKFTRTGGANAVLSGLFFGGQVAPPSATATFIQTDTTTQGNWQSAYGADGYNVIGDSSSYPSYARVSPSGQNNYTWAASTSDVRALTKATNTSDRIAATWYNSSTFSVDVDLTDGQTHQVAVYVLDWDSTRRSERIDVIDTGTGILLNTQTATSFNGGEYFVWDISGNATIKFTRTGGDNAVLSGLFFGGSAADPENTYYVSTNGNDGNNGSATSPWQTLQHAVDSGLQPGDTVIVTAGTYAGFVMGWNTNPAGTVSDPITIEADPSAAPGSVIINSQNPYTAVAADLEPGSDYVTVEDFTIENDGTVTRDGIKATGKHDSILNNTVTGVGGQGIFANNAPGIVISGNTVSGTLGTNSTGHGVYVAGESTGAIIRGNIIHDNGAIGIHINGDSGGVGTLNVLQNALIENNVIYNNTTEAGINCDGLQNSTIRNNLIYGYASYGISLYRIDAGGPSSGNIIVNNTIYSTRAGSGAAIRIKDGAINNTLYNNILLGGDGSSIRISNDSLPGFVSDYNVVTGTFQSEDTGDYMTLAQWQSMTGQDQHSIVATAAQLFVNAAGGDFHLLSTSPAIGAGTAIDAPSTDLDGKSRSGRIDIGCYQF
jgi:hypothetical protein